ncbi:MAG TPA: transposase [Thermoleophilaceae bacterium]|nr:transposase [Thermoleophilaceae bacterium]
MAQNFLPCDREQELLLPPSLHEWLPEDHLAWFVLDAVAQFDAEPFYASYRRDGWGAAAHDPQMMVALLVYAYAIGERSLRAIERRCSEDVAFRVIAANQAPDHATVARFRVRHEAALADLFGQVLALCADAGLVSVGVIGRAGRVGTAVVGVVGLSYLLGGTLNLPNHLKAARAAGSPPALTGAMGLIAAGFGLGLAGNAAAALAGAGRRRG